MGVDKLFAAVDLGSNSFHLIIMREEHGRLILVDRLREMVQLAFGISETGELDSEVEVRALNCLSRFGERLSGMERSQIRVVGTNALRILQNHKSFIHAAEEKLKVNIDIISGHEEARLIYLGVSQSINFYKNKIFVIDIGGGSTEFIIGNDADIEFITSLEMGCVSYTKQFFKNKINAENIEKTNLAVADKLHPYLKTLQNNACQLVGASGSIKTIANLLLKEKLSDNYISLEALNKLLTRVIKHKSTKAIAKYYDLSLERAEVLLAGLVILRQIFLSLNLEQMLVAETAMREGIILDLLKLEHRDDIKNITINSLVTRFSIDQNQAQRVADTSIKLAEMINLSSNTPPQCMQYLTWAAQLHELGLLLSYSHYHRHSAYIIQHTDLNGFSEQDKLIISTIIQHHRRRIYLEAYDDLPDFVLILTIILRLSVILNRTRQYIKSPLPSLLINEKEITLKFSNQFIGQYPLLEEDLRTEEKYLAQIDYQLNWSFK